MSAPPSVRVVRDDDREARCRQVRAVDAAELPPLLGLLARAFVDDPFVGWVVRGGAGREERAQAYFDLMLRRVSFARGGAFATTDLAGVAAWVPPGAWPPSVGAQVAMLPQTLSFVGLARLGVVSEGAELMEARRPRAPHWHLALLGVEPTAQGGGVGTALLRDGLARADADGLVAHVETSRASNVPFYERAGFRLVHQLVLPGEGPAVWVLQRPPRSR
jgi:ribosomal protein S18 acetylase RimI-like enzyme